MATDQSLADMPLWFLVVLAMAGLSGEMLRASGANLTPRQLVQRVLFRFAASGFSGMAVFLICIAKDANVYMAGGLSIGVALVGADIFGAISAQWLARRAGVGAVGQQQDR